MNAHQRRIARRAFNRTYGDIMPCPLCCGRSYDGDDICLRCGGRGLVYERARVMVNKVGIVFVFPVVQ